MTRRSETPQRGGGVARTRAGGHGRRWSEDDDAELRRLIAAREPAVRIAHALRRTQDAIRGRAAELHLTLPSPLRPWKRFAKPGGRREHEDTEPQDQQLETAGPAPEGDA